MHENDLRHPPETVGTLRCHLCYKEFPHGMEHLMLRSDEEIRKNVHDVAVFICPGCAKKLVAQGYRSCTAKSGHRLILREGER